MRPLTTAEAARALEHRGLVGTVVNRVRRSPEDQADAFQDGFIGLCRAVQLDTGEEATFAAYATWWIRQGIQEGRARREGANFRRARAAGAVHRWPLSLDATDLPVVVDPVDVEAQALGALVAVDVEVLLLGSCNTPVDIDIACGLLAGRASLGEQDRLIGAAHALNVGQVASRRTSLRRRVARELVA